MHLSTEGLPDWRIEKSAITSQSQGHDVLFAGSKSPFKYDRNTFSKVYEINWTAKARYGLPYYWSLVQKQLSKIIKEARPEIVHAHNIFSAKMMLDFDLPFVYDDHEYWSKHSRLLLEMEKLNEIKTEKANISKILINMPKRIKRSLINRHVNHLWTKWEEELVSSIPTITVSNEIANDLRVIGNSDKIFVVPNFPMKFETDGFKSPQPHKSLSSVYAGSDGHNKKKYPSRNIDGLLDIFTSQDIGELTIVGWSGELFKNVKYTGFLDRRDMYNEMANHSIGLVPFKKHWSHGYINPNKAYEYAHAGLYVMCTNSFAPLRVILKEHCVTFEDYDDMVSKLSYFKHNLNELYDKRLKLFDYARSNLIWEQNAKKILDAYRAC
ncbi:MAG: glycosyltransferase family 4 protein [Nitrosopumilus sp.]|nr:glycosyltransferase family 4 protein [Nitrosopumilus sp.]